MSHKCYISGFPATCAQAATAMGSLKSLNSLRPERQGKRWVLQMMGTGAAASHEFALVATFAREVGQRLGAAMAEIAPGVFDSYCPELHYMRGPARNGMRSTPSPPQKTHPPVMDQSQQVIGHGTCRNQMTVRGSTPCRSTPNT